jgi:hypothetical protein
MAKAAVLPEPVCDWPTTSAPVRRGGYGLGLDHGGFFKAHLLDGLEDLRRKAELGEKFLLHQGL